MKKIFLMFVLLLTGVSFCSADAYDYLAGKISKGGKVLTNKKVAVLPFQYYDGRESPGSTIVSERLTTAIVQGNKLQVVERTLLDKVMDEMKLDKTGIIDQQTTKELGKILGVEAIVTGTLIEEVNSDKVEINARLIKIETGDILVAASRKIDKTWIDAAPVISKNITEPAVESPAPQPAPAPAAQNTEVSQETQSKPIPVELESSEKDLNEGNFEEGLAKAMEVFRNYSDKPYIATRALFIAGRIHEERGEFGKARLAYLKIIKDYPFNTRMVKMAQTRVIIMNSEMPARRR